MMSEDDLKGLPSVHGYLNIQELSNTLLKALGVGSFSAFALTLLTVILDNANAIYVGPKAALVISIASMVAAMLKARQVGSRYLHEGE